MILSERFNHFGHMTEAVYDPKPDFKTKSITLQILLYCVIDKFVVKALEL